MPTQRTAVVVLVVCLILGCTHGGHTGDWSARKTVQPVAAK